MNVYLPENNLTQELFDKYKEDVFCIVEGGGMCNIYITKKNEPIGTTTLMEGYWDIDDEGGSSPHFWYNKKELDEHNIKY